MGPGLPERLWRRPLEQRSQLLAGTRTHTGSRMIGGTVGAAYATSGEVETQHLGGTECSPAVDTPIDLRFITECGYKHPSLSEHGSEDLRPGLRVDPPERIG